MHNLNVITKLYTHNNVHSMYDKIIYYNGGSNFCRRSGFIKNRNQIMKFDFVTLVYNLKLENYNLEI